MATTNSDASAEAQMNSGRRMLRRTGRMMSAEEAAPNARGLITAETAPKAKLHGAKKQQQRQQDIQAEARSARKETRQLGEGSPELYQFRLW